MKEFTLRPYQVDDIAFMTKHKRVLNANEPGLGKTLETLTAINNLPPGKTLIISPKMATGVWQFEAMQWYGWEGERVTGEFSKVQRNEIRREFDRSNMHFMMINFAMIEETQTWRSEWNTIVVDEAHLGGLLSYKSNTFKLMQRFKCNHLFLLTGTPVRRDPGDLYPMLHLLHPKRFRDYWPFVNKYCHVIQGQFGKEIMGIPKKPGEFKAMLDEYMVRHKKKDVLTDLPDKIRQPVPVEMEGKQLAAYHELLEEMMLELDDGDVLLTPNRLTQDLRLRQLLVCPRIIGIEDDGIALRTMCDYLIPEEFASGRSIAIGTPFRTAVPFVEAALRKAFPKAHLEFIHGQMKETAQEVAQRFQEHKSKEKILIYTIKSGASWTAHAASTGFMLGYEWSCTDQIQAEDRIHRIGQTETVFWKYLLHKGTIDEAVMNRLDEKTMSTTWILTPKEIQDKLNALREEYLSKNK